MKISGKIEKQLKRIYGNNYDPKKIPLYLNKFKKGDEKGDYKIFDVEYEKFSDDSIDEILDLIREDYGDDFLKATKNEEISFDNKVKILKKYDFILLENK